MPFSARNGHLGKVTAPATCVAGGCCLRLGSVLLIAMWAASPPCLWLVLVCHDGNALISRGWPRFCTVRSNTVDWGISAWGRGHASVRTPSPQPTGPPIYVPCWVKFRAIYSFFFSTLSDHVYPFAMVLCVALRIEPRR